MKIKNFNDATLVITVLNYMTALRNCEDPKNRRRYQLVWLYDIFHLFLFVASIIYLTIFCVNHLAYNFIRTMCQFLTFMSSVVYISVLTIGWYHSKDVLMVRRKIDIVDEKLKSLGLVIDYPLLFYRVIIISVILISNVIVLCVFNIIWNKDYGCIITFSIVGHVYAMNVGVVALSEFAIYVSWLNMRFKQTNDFFVTFIMEDRRVASKGEDGDKMAEQFEPKFNHLHRNMNRWLLNYQKVLPTTQFVNKRESRFAKKLHTLQDIRFVQLQLCSIVKMLNNIFCMQLMLYTSTVVVQVVIILYAIYVELYQSDVLFLTPNAEKFVVSCVDTVYNFLKIVLICYICERTMKEANKLIEIVHSYSVHDVDTEMKDEILQFCLQISFCQMRWSRDNFLQLNYNFLRGCISFVATYLVVMVQWSQTADPNDSFLYQNETSLF